MPYNNTPIAPSDVVTGTVSLPLARVKKIIHADDDINNCSNNAAFAITVATELFLQYLVEQTHNVMKSDNRGQTRGRQVRYNDVAGAVSRVDNLEFLSDVVPKTIKFKELKARKAKADAAAPKTNGQSRGLTNGKTTHAAPAAPVSIALGVPVDVMDVDSDVPTNGTR